MKKRFLNCKKTKQALVDQLIKPGEQMLHQLSTEEIKTLLELN
ncbi:Snf2 family helicase [Listeria floridensis FSL S10-1187]|uniref:Snf2 family helicase n=1 Tax=Listeria floridensis FSL S10-1187 TaxID=1265817 RepID=A0ABN0RG62_9LIST|nr:Snf2 family helicase [Listeria floridensis FSL S10-1187]